MYADGSYDMLLHNRAAHEGAMVKLCCSDKVFPSFGGVQTFKLNNKMNSIRNHKLQEWSSLVGAKSVAVGYEMRK